MSCRIRLWLLGTVFVCLSPLTCAQQSQENEGPYFVTYPQYMEEAGDLEVNLRVVQGKPNGGNRFLGSALEFEYGTRDWWATEFYLDGQWTRNESAIFTGWRIENRFRLLQGNHPVIPVLYVEYENLNGADKSLLEVVGFDSQKDNAVPNDVARLEHEHEIETRLILGSDINRWNLSGNFIGEKNLSNEPWEFGYAAGVSRLIASAGTRQTLSAGVEFYGGLGDWHRFTIHDTSQYLGICLTWKLPRGPLIRISPTFGLTSQSYDFLFRFGISQEIEHVGRRIRSLF